MTKINTNLEIDEEALVEALSNLSLSSLENIMEQAIKLKKDKVLKGKSSLSDFVSVLKPTEAYIYDKNGRIILGVQDVNRLSKVQKEAIISDYRVFTDDADEKCALVTLKDDIYTLLKKEIEQLNDNWSLYRVNGFYELTSKSPLGIPVEFEGETLEELLDNIILELKSFTQERYILENSELDYSILVKDAKDVESMLKKLANFSKYYPLGVF